MKWPFGRDSLGKVARIGALSAMAVSSGAFVGCDDSDDAPPLAIGAQWFDANEGEATVSALDFPAAQEVVDTAGVPIEYGASVSLSPAVFGIQVLFNEPLNADVIEDLTINGTGEEVDEPVNLDEGVIINRKSKYNPGVIAFTGRVGLVEVVDATTGVAYEAVSEYLNNIRANESIVSRDYGISVTPLDLLPSNTEFHLRIYAGEIKDRDGNILRAAARTQIPEGGGRAETVGEVTAADGRPIAAVAVFATDPISVTAVTAGTTEDDTSTHENETAILVEFNTDIDLDSAQAAFTLTDVDGNEIPVTVIAAESGDAADEAEVNTGAVQVVPDAPLAAGDYELRIDPVYADAFHVGTTASIQIEPLTVE